MSLLDRMYHGEVERPAAVAGVPAVGGSWRAEEGWIMRKWRSWRWMRAPRVRPSQSSARVSRPTPSPTRRNKNRNSHLLDSAKKQVASDQPWLAKTEAEAASAPGGDSSSVPAWVTSVTAIMARPPRTLRPASPRARSRTRQDARLLLGIAQLKAGNKDEAMKTFKTVKGDPLDERLAALWVLHARASGGARGPLPEQLAHLRERSRTGRRPGRNPPLRKWAPRRPC